VAGTEGQKYDIKPPVIGLLQRAPSARKYFYIDGKLYRTLLSDRANDIIRAWSYEDKCIVQFVWTDAKRNMQQAFNTSEVCKLLNRTKKNLLEHLHAGDINLPYKIGAQKADIKKHEFGRYKWSEDDVLALHEHYLTVGTGRPRKDGILTAAPRIPSRMELIAMMKQNRMVYIQDASGSFVPIFDQPDWTL
jgi:hypothetical protein